MKYTIPDVEGTTLMEATLDTVTHKGEDHIILIKADKEQWLTPEQAEDLIHALARLVTRGRQAIRQREVDETNAVINELFGSDEEKPKKGFLS